MEPCSPPTNNTKLTTYKTNTAINELLNGGVERCSPPRTRPATTVRSRAPRPWHHSDHTTMNITSDPTKGPNQQLGLHPVLTTKSQPLQPRKRHDTPLSHRMPPLSPTHPAWYHRSVLVSGAGPPVCLPQPGQSRASKMPSIITRDTHFPHRTSSGRTTKDSRSETTTRPRRPDTDPSP